MSSRFNINFLLNYAKDNEKIYNEVLVILLGFVDVKNPEIFPRFTELSMA